MQVSGTAVLFGASQSERELWDAFVASHPAGHLLQSYAWGELKSAFGWETVRLALQEGEHLRAAAQVLFRHLPGTALAYIPRGPVLDWQDKEAAAALFAAMAAAGRRRGAAFLKVEPNLPDTPQARAHLQALGLRPARTVQPRATLVIDLLGDEELLAQMKPKTRYNVRLAMRRGVTVRPAAAASEVDLFYDMLLETGRRDSFGVHRPEYYRSVYRLLNQADMAVLLFAEREGRVLAGLWAAAWGSEAIYLYGASRADGQEHMPSYLLQWEAMRWARERGCTHYDLWGIPDSVARGTDPRQSFPKKNVRDGLWGVYRFKQGFGGRTACTVGAYDLPYRPWLYRLYRGLLGG